SKLMFFKRRTKLETKDISLMLDRGWEQSKGDNPTLAEFDNPTEHKHLSVSVLSINAPCNSSAELRQAVEDVYKVRLEAERTLIAPDDPIMADGVVEAAGRSLGFFCGLQRTTGRLFAGYLYGVGSIVVTLYLEGFGSDPKQHMDCLVSIFNQLKIK